MTLEKDEYQHVPKGGLHWQQLGGRFLGGRHQKNESNEQPAEEGGSNQPVDGEHLCNARGA